MRPTRSFEIIVFSGLAALIPQPAFAYIDPGLGSLIFQGAIAGFVTIAAAWAGLKMKILALFSKPENSGNRDDNAQG